MAQTRKRPFIRRSFCIRSHLLSPMPKTTQFLRWFYFLIFHLFGINTSSCTEIKQAQLLQDLMNFPSLAACCKITLVTALPLSINEQQEDVGLWSLIWSERIMFSIIFCLGFGLGFWFCLFNIWFNIRMLCNLITVHQNAPRHFTDGIDCPFKALQLFTLKTIFVF